MNKKGVKGLFCITLFGVLVGFATKSFLWGIAAAVGMLNIAYIITFILSVFLEDLKKIMDATKEP